MVAGEHCAVRPKITAAVADPEQRRELKVALKHGLFPVWDDLPDEKRELLLAYDEMVCPQCGNLVADCSDPTRDWHPRTSVCWASATREWAEGWLRKQNPDEDLPDDEMSYLAGRYVWVSQQPVPDDEDEFKR
jgi:hypothetical protein